MADKWMVCTDWRQAVFGLPSISSPWAQEGTEAHEVLELSLRTELPPWDITDNLEMAIAVSTVIKWLKKFMVQNPGAKYFIEHKVEWGSVIGYPTLKGRTKLLPNEKRVLDGTSDLPIVTKKKIYVADYKHGFYIVNPKTSKQLRVYLMGLIKKFGERPAYELLIFQPRAQHEDGPIRSHQVSRHEMRVFTQQVEYAVETNFSGKGKRVAGKHCTYCPASAKCRALTEYNLKVASKEFSSAP
jgi:Protein of unknown function (DUF2800)